MFECRHAEADLFRLAPNAVAVNGDDAELVGAIMLELRSEKGRPCHDLWPRLIAEQATLREAPCIVKHLGLRKLAVIEGNNRYSLRRLGYVLDITGHVDNLVGRNRRMGKIA